MRKLWLARDKKSATSFEDYFLYSGNKPIRDIEGYWSSGGSPNNCYYVTEMCMHTFHEVVGNIPRLRKGQCIEIKSIKFTLPKKKGK